MVYAALNGVTLPFAGDSAGERPEQIGIDRRRTMNGSLVMSHVGRKGRWIGNTKPLVAATAQAFRSLIEGDGHAWRFADSLYSFAGVGPSSSTGCTQSATGGKYAGKLAITSGNRFEAALARRMARPAGWDPTQGWTLMVWKKTSVADGGDGSTYVLHIATGSVVVTRGASANPASVTQYRSGTAGNWSMGNWITVASDGDVAIHAHDNAGTPTAYDYSDLVVLPFALPSSWVAGIVSFLATAPWGESPFSVLSGDVLEGSGLTTADVHGVVNALAHRNVHLDGSHRNNAQVLDIELVQR